MNPHLRFPARLPAAFAALLLAQLLGASLAAQAGPSDRIYIGGDFSGPHFQDPVNGISGTGSGISGKLYSGYRLSTYFSLEFGLVDLGHFDNAAGKVYGHAQYLDAIGLAPLSETWSLFGSVGAAHATLHTRALLNNVSTTAKDSGTGLKLGLGFQYALASNVALRVELERYKPSVFGDRPAIDQRTAGVSMAF